MKNSTLIWVNEQVNNTKGLVRGNKAKEKLTAMLSQVDLFSEDNINFEKKELTKITNQFDRVCSNYFNLFYNDAEMVSKRDKMEDSDEKTALTFISVNYLNMVKRYYSKLSNLNFTIEQKDYLETYYPNMDKWAELSIILGNVHKVLNPTKEEQELRLLKQIKGSINPELRKSIDEIAEEFRVLIELKHFNTYNKRIELFKELYPNGGFSKDIENLHLFIDFIEYNKTSDFRRIATIKTDAVEVATKKAKDESYEVITRWQIKMYDKLGGDFVKTFDNGFTTTVHGTGYLNNEIDFMFSDGSRFSMRNQIVPKISNKGTFFYTFPTTFHDAYLADGNKITSPNEFTVKKAFQDFYNN